MTDSDTSQIPRARVIRRRWPGLVWAVPGAALLVVGYLGIKSFANRGIDVVVTFPSASGISPGDTKVLENGVEVGRVSEVRIAPDNRHVDLTLHLDHRVEPALTDQARFWIIGANPNIADLQSVKAAIAGVTIGMETAGTQSGTPKRRYVGLNQAPLIPIGAKGQAYMLTAKALGSLTRGASVRYRGQEIGKVTQTAMQDLDRFRIAIWIDAPYDHLVRQGAQFWTGSPLKIKLGGGGLSTELATPASLVQGAIQFDLPDEDRANPVLPAGATLPLFADQSAAQQGDPGPEIPYTLLLRGDAGDLDRGTPVTLLGYQVGEVAASRLAFSANGAPFTVATIRLYAHKFDVTADGRAALDTAIARLLRQGYRASLIQTPPLVGAHAIALTHERQSAAQQSPAGLMRVAGYADPVIPAADGGNASMDDILAKVDQIVSKINHMPLDQIGRNVQGLTANLRDITAEAKPKIGPLLDKLNATAQSLDAAADAARTTLGGEGANQNEGLPETIRQLNEMARSIRALTDYVGRHPEALIRGKAKEKAQ